MRSAECGEFFNTQNLQRRPHGEQFFFVNGQFRIRNHHVNAAVVQDVADLGGLEEIVDWHDHRVRLQNAEDARDELRAILQPECDAVARLHAELILQVGGDLLRLRENLGVGDFAVAPKDGFLLRVFIRAVLESSG